MKGFQKLMFQSKTDVQVGSVRLKLDARSEAGCNGERLSDFGVRNKTKGFRMEWSSTCVESSMESSMIVIKRCYEEL